MKPTSAVLKQVTPGDAVFSGHMSFLVRDGGGVSKILRGSRWTHVPDLMPWGRWKKANEVSSKGGGSLTLLNTLLQARHLRVVSFC